jgi:hypothetical protein
MWKDFLTIDIPAHTRAHARYSRCRENPSIHPQSFRSFSDQTLNGEAILPFLEGWKDQSN